MHARSNVHYILFVLTMIFSNTSLHRETVSYETSCITFAAHLDDVWLVPGLVILKTSNTLLNTVTEPGKDKTNQPTKQVEVLYTTASSCRVVACLSCFMWQYHTVVDEVRAWVFHLLCM